LAPPLLLLLLNRVNLFSVCLVDIKLCVKKYGKNIRNRPMTMTLSAAAALMDAKKKKTILKSAELLLSI